MWAPSPWDEGAPGGEELNKGEEAWMDYFLDAELSPQDSPPSGRAAKQAKQHGGETPGSGGAAPAYDRAADYARKEPASGAAAGVRASAGAGARAAAAAHASSS